MTDKLPVKEHLKNGALYCPSIESFPHMGWKQRLFCQYITSRQIKEALRTRSGISKWFIWIGVPLACILLMFAVYFEFLPLDQWRGILNSIENWNLPPIGLKEVFIFIVAVNGLTFLIRKKPFTL